MTTVQQIAAGLETTVMANIAANTLRFYSEGAERPNPPSAVVMWRGTSLLDDCSWRSTMSIEVSVPIGNAGKERAIRTLRDLADMTISGGIVQIIRANPTLGISGVRAMASRVEPERSATFADGKRVAAYIQVEVMH